VAENHVSAALRSTGDRSEKLEIAPFPSENASPMTDGCLPAVDATLRQSVAAISRLDPHWAALPRPKADASQPQFQYPAMMVPAMQRQLLEVACRVQPHVRKILEPFAGSGTIVVEAMLRGLDVKAQDINPLSILLCRARTAMLPVDDLQDAIASVSSRSKADRRRVVEASFSGLQKWFRVDAARELSSLRRAIRTVPNADLRRFLWVGLAETVRLTCNSRTSTYKLHIRAPEDILRLPRPMTVFRAIVDRNLAAHARLIDRLAAAGHMRNGRYRGAIEIRLGDSRYPTSGTFDLLMTSPPYGDNTSTVPYGQAAYLPLQWVDFADISSNAHPSALASTYEIDTRSLGGNRKKWDYSERYGDLLSRSGHLVRLVAELARHPTDRLSRVLAFLYDLDAAAAAALHVMRTNSYLFWTTGNRRVGGLEVALHRILPDLFEVHGARLVLTVRRRIPSKRMASRNAIASTMNEERVLVFRKQGDS
jgi:hypothetical protein